LRLCPDYPLCFGLRLDLLCARECVQTIALHLGLSYFLGSCVLSPIWESHECYFCRWVSVVAEGSFTFKSAVILRHETRAAFVLIGVGSPRGLRCLRWWQFICSIVVNLRGLDASVGAMDGIGRALGQGSGLGAGSEHGWRDRERPSLAAVRGGQARLAGRCSAWDPLRGGDCRAPWAGPS